MPSSIDILIEEKAVIAHCANGSIRVPYQDIAYVECAQRKIVFFLKNSDTFSTKQVRTSFLGQLERLLQDARFACPHQSFFVNFDFVRQFSNTELKMDGGQIIPISKNRRKLLRARYQQFLMQKSTAPLALQDALSLNVLASFQLPLVALIYNAKKNVFSLWYANDNTAALYGLTLTKMHQKYGADICVSVHPEDEPAFRSFLAQCSSAQPSALCYWLKSTDGYKRVNLLLKAVDQRDPQTLYGMYVPMPEFKEIFDIAHVVSPICDHAALGAAAYAQAKMGEE